jgi:DinB superfamily
MTTAPADSEYARFYASYVGKLAGEGDVVAVLERQRGELAALPAAAGERETHRYADGKWSVREVVGHLGDAERVFGYRLFCISRGEQQSLPGFDENVYAARSGADARPLADLVAELLALREVNLGVVRRLGAAEWDQRGVANSHPITVRALAYVLAGHCRHHLDILRERYGVAAA